MGNAAVLGARIRIMRLAVSLLTTSVLSLAGSAFGNASEIYRWVGDDGVVQYSDTKPEAEDFTAVELTDTSPRDYDPAEDPYSIVNQARRLNEVWAGLARARQEREQQRREEAQNDPRFMSPRYDPYAYSGRFAYFSSGLPGVHRNNRIGAGRRQHQALAELNLLGPRPPSVNSGAHRARVMRSERLPLSH